MLYLVIFSCLTDQLKSLYFSEKPSLGTRKESACLKKTSVRHQEKRLCLMKAFVSYQNKKIMSQENL